MRTINFSYMYSENDFEEPANQRQTCMNALEIKSKDILWWSVCLQREGYSSVEVQNPKQGFFF